MKKLIAKNISLIFAIFVVIAIGTSFKFFPPKATVKSVSLDQPYTNEHGEKWGPLPEGPYAFRVASADDSGPVFLEGKIDPLDVKPGDIQKMRVVVRSPSGIRSVLAQIETDKGINEVSLRKSGAARVDDLMLPKFNVKDGVLNVLTPKEIAEEVMKEYAKENGLFTNKAIAAEEGEREIWEGEWLVKDTHTKTYETTFVAIANDGKTKSVTMSWSDPCGFPVSGVTAVTISSDCYVGSSQINFVDGWDGGDITINSDADLLLTLETSGTFIWNPGSSIFINPGGTISISSGHQLVQGYLYYNDSDLDGYVSTFNSKSYGSNSTAPSGKIRMRTAPTIADCYDSGTNANLAHPGQTQYFGMPRGDGSYDYDCNGSGNDSTSPAPGVGQCDSLHPPVDICTDTNRNGVSGFTTSVSCNNSGTYVVEPGGCYTLNDSPLPCVTETRLYSCGTPADLLYPSANGSCTVCGFDELNCTETAPGNSGWSGGSALACGESGTYYDDPGFCDASSCNPTGCQTSTRTQSCR